MATEERRLAAIMFSDICGYSRIMGEDEERALSLVETHNQVVASGAEQYGGRIIKKMGDGLLAEFSSAVNAVRCAIAVQEAISEFNAEAAEKDRIYIRIGIHLGDVVVSDGDILGDGVNVASRIEPLAEPGGICISRDILDLIQNKIAIQAVHIGAKELKNISKQIDIYKLLIDAVSQHGPASQSQKTKPAGTVIITPRKNSRFIIGILIGIAGIVLFIMLGGMLKRLTLNTRAGKKYAETVRQVEKFRETKDYDSAINLLKNYPKTLSETPWQKDIDRMLKEIRPEAAKETVKRNCTAFFEAICREDWDAAMEFIHPDEKMEIGKQGMEMRLKMFAAVAVKLGKITSDRVRVSEVEINSDGDHATARIEILKKGPDGSDGEWIEAKPSRWHLVDGKWYTLKKGPIPDGPDGENPAGPGRRREGGF